MFISDEAGPVKAGDFLVDGSGMMVRRLFRNESPRRCYTLDGPRFVQALADEHFIAYPVRMVKVLVSM
jgi:hypothetical protein